jgi:hypothetical protein
MLKSLIVAEISEFLAFHSKSDIKRTHNLVEYRCTKPISKPEKGFFYGSVYHIFFRKQQEN